ncbi:MAG: general stress protein [Chloroflexota bacterium]
MKTVAGLFDSRTSAEQALQDLRTAGFDSQRVSVMARDPDRARDVAKETGAEVTTGAATGAGLGAILGGAAGWLVGIGALAIPGIGPIVAAGPIAAALGVAGTTAAAGAGVGIVAGGLVGALTGWGFSESEARAYEQGVERGDILLAVEAPDDQAGSIEDVFKRRGGDRVSTGTARR